MKCATSW